MTQQSAASSSDDELATLRRRVAELEAAQLRQQAELDALRTTSQRLQTILERSPVVLYETDAESRFVFVEGRGLERLGLTREQLLGRSGMELFGSVTGVNEHHDRVASGTATESTFRIGAAIFRLWSAPRLDEHGQYLGTYGVAIDTTPQSLAEEQLQEREEFFHMLTSVSPTGLYHSVANECVFANQRALEIAGLEPGEISNEAWRNVLHPDDRDRVIADWTDAIAHKRRYVAEYRFLRRDGQTVWVQGEAVPRLDGAGNVIGAVGAITDITAIKRAEAQLQTHHDWLQSIAATVPGVIGVYNIRTFRYSFVSRGFRTLLGYDPRELLDGNFEWIKAHTHPDDFERVQGESLAAVSEDDQIPGADQATSPVKVFEYRMRHADGSWRWVQTIGTVFTRDAEGKIVDVLNVTLDISARHAMEEQLRRSQQELEQRVRERTAEHEQANEYLRREIKQRKTTEARLAEQNKLLQSVLNSMSDGVKVVDARGELVMTNKAAERILGLHVPRQSWRFEGRAFRTDQTTPLAAHELPTHRALHGAVVRNTELYLAPTDHAPRGTWLNVSSDPLRNERGEITGAVTIFGDDTARRQTLQALNESLERFHLVVDGSQVGLWDAWVNQADPLHLDNKIYYSRHMATLLGVTYEQFGDTIGAWARFVHPDDQARVFAALQAHMDRNEVYDIEYRCITAQGETRWFAARGASIRDAQNRPVRMSGSFVDITPRKLAEAALAEKEGQLRTMMDATTAVVYIKALDGKYLYINREFEKLFSISRTDMEGRTDYELFDAEVAEAFRRNDQAVVDSPKPVQYEEYAPHDDGMHTYVSVKFALRNLQGTVYATCGISTDITERKRDELQLRKEQAFLQGLLEVNERDRQMMAYDIHDGLIQFLTSSVMEVDALTRTPQLTADQRQRCQKVCDMLRQAINDGRRVLSGLRPPVLDASGIVVALEYLVAEQRERFATDVSLTLRVRFKRLAPLLEVTIYRIVQEALNNVNKHSQAKSVDVILFEMGDKLRLTIRDDGRGFDPAQVDPARFGLQGMRKRAELMGGTLDVESSVGHGTQVSVTLPRQLPDAATPKLP